MRSLAEARSLPADVPPVWNLTLDQPRAGYRFSVDAFLLADFVLPLVARSPMVDLGTGCGVVALLLARRFADAHLLGIELQWSLAQQARQNVIASELSPRVDILQADVRHVMTLLPPGAFSTVVCNPPYHRVGEGRLNPNPAKAMARHEVALTLPQMLESAQHVLCHRGVLALIYPPARLVELCIQLDRLNLVPRRLRLVHVSSGGEASMFLIEAVRGGGDPLTVMPPLYVYDAAGEYSPEMAAIFQGRDLGSNLRYG